MAKFGLDLCAVKFQSVSEAVDEDCRICWRGRAMPKHFKGGLNDEMKSSMMKKAGPQADQDAEWTGEVEAHGGCALLKGRGQRHGIKLRPCLLL